MSFNLKKYSNSVSSFYANTPEAEQYKFNIWDKDIKSYIEEDDFKGLKGYIESKDEIRERDFFIFLMSNISHYGYLFDSDRYSKFLEVLSNLGVIK